MMMKLTIKAHSLIKYPVLSMLLAHDFSIAKCLRPEDIDKTYVIKLQSRLFEEKSMKLSIVEVCALYGLETHLDYLCHNPGPVIRHLFNQKFRAFRFAIANGHTGIFTKLLDLIPDKLTTILSTLNYYIFRFAVQYEQYKAAQHLIKIAHTQVVPMVAAHQFKALYLAYHNQDERMIFLLFQFDKVLSHAIEHQRIFDRFIHMYIDQVVKQINNDNRENYKENVIKLMLTFLIHQQQLSPSQYNQNKIACLIEVCPNDTY